MMMTGRISDKKMERPDGIRPAFEVSRKTIQTPERLLSYKTIIKKSIIVMAERLMTGGIWLRVCENICFSF